MASVADLAVLFNKQNLQNTAIRLIYDKVIICKGKGDNVPMGYQER